MLTKSNPMELLVDSRHGIYVPQVFAQTVRRDLFGDSISAEDFEIISAGPDADHYWEAWEAILNSAETTDGVSLWQDGDLWAVNWSLIGDSEEIADLGVMALHRLRESESTRELIAELHSALMDGPSAGRWSQEMLTELRERVELIADQISAELPVYWRSDFGIEEIRPDIESLMIAESGYLQAIADYW
jgi:hypothetical protein